MNSCAKTVKPKQPPGAKNYNAPASRNISRRIWKSNNQLCSSLVTAVWASTTSEPRCSSISCHLTTSVLMLCDIPNKFQTTESMFYQAILTVCEAVVVFVPCECVSQNDWFFTRRLQPQDQEAFYCNGIEQKSSFQAYRLRGIGKEMKTQTMRYYCTQSSFETKLPILMCPSNHRNVLIRIFSPAMSPFYLALVIRESVILRLIQIISDSGLVNRWLHLLTALQNDT